MINYSIYDEDIFYHQTQRKLNSILSDEDIMFHYTSIDALRQIVSNQCLFATHINFMNDWQEYTVGYEKLTKAIKEAITNHIDVMSAVSEEEKKYIFNIIYDQCLNVTNYSNMKKIKGNMEYRECMMPEVYSVSFCSSRDLLNQWSMYAKESGVAIGFDFHDFVLCDASLTNEEMYEEEDWQQIKYFRYNKPHKVSYSEQDMQIKIDEQVNEVIRELVNPGFMAKYPTIKPTSYLIQEIAKLYAMVPFFKVDKFKGEEEIRLAFMRLNKVVTNMDGSYREYRTKVFHRESNHVLKPYIKIGWEAQDSSKADETPIKRIVVGPGSNQEAVFRGIIHFIESQDKNVIPCKEGHEPFMESLVDNVYKTGNGIYIQKSTVPFIF